MIYLNISNNISILNALMNYYIIVNFILPPEARDPSSYLSRCGNGKCEEISVLSFSMTVGDRDPSSFLSRCGRKMCKIS